MPDLKPTNWQAFAEVTGFMLACQIYLWWIYPNFRAGRWLLALYVCGSLAVRHETRLGFNPKRNLPEILRWGGWLFAAMALAVLAYGWRIGRVTIVLPDLQALTDFTGYLLWCVLQVFVTQSFLHNRLADAFPGRIHFTSFLTALLFASMHLPSPVLMAATFFGGFAMSELFLRYRNIWPLAIFQALLSASLVAAFPDEWMHRLRVGAGYFRWIMQV